MIQHAPGLAFQHLDENKDGRISKEEVLKHFSSVDDNGDGSVTKEELLKKIHAAHPGHGPAAAGERPAADAAPGGALGSRGAGRPAGPPSAETFFSKLDKNKDGKLASDEVPSMMWERMSRSDTDKDGSVSKAELEEHFKQMALQGRGRSGRTGPPRGNPSGPDKKPPTDEKKDAPASDSKTT